MKKSIAILGAGESGIGAALLGAKHGYTVLVSDAGIIAGDNKLILETHGVEYEEGGHSDERMLTMDEVIKSPGIPDRAPLIEKLHRKGIPVISEIEFAYRHLEDHVKVIAITGTNGKTTTTLLTHHLFKTAGKKVALGGNVGVSLAKLVAEGGYDYYVVEVSSFQLDGIVKFRPDVAVLLNITPDHMDRYEYDFEKYVASKFRIIENLSQSECFIYCADSEPVSREVSKRKIESCLFAISATNNSRWQAYLDSEHLIFNYKYKEKSKKHRIPVSEVALIGRHNMINSMAAVLSGLWMDLPINKIVKGLRSFRNAPHRLEFCGEIDGVRFINDSKATNVDSVYYALEGIKENIVWIAGGIDKGNAYEQIAPLVREKVKGLICLGVDNTPLTNFFEKKLSRMEQTRKITDAVEMGLAMASPGDVVLLSPACASFDLFRNYEDRGDQFRKAVKSLIISKKAKV